MTASNFVHLRVKDVLRQTDAAILVCLDDEDETELWLPLSQIADPEDVEVGDTDCEIAVTKWIARAKGLEVED